MLLHASAREGEITVAADAVQPGRPGASQRSDSMVLSPERRARIRQRLDPFLKEFDPNLLFLAVFVDSSREYLAIATQLEDKPVLLKFRWVDFISTPDDVLRTDLHSQLIQKLGSPASPSASEPAAQES